MRRWAPWLAGGLLVVGIGCWLLSGLAGQGSFSLDDFVWASSFLGFPVVGLLVAARRPDHPLGWCWLAGFAALGLGVSLETIAEAALFPMQTAVWANWLALAGAVINPVALVLLAFPATLFFPDGHLPSPRWRPVAAVGLGALAVFLLATLLKPTIVLGGGTAANPMPFIVPWMESVLPAAAVILFLVVAAGAISLIVRYRTASGVERSQLKWVAFSLAAALVGLVFALLEDELGIPGDWAGLLPWLVAGWGFPTAVAIAVLRFHLYDIDRIINRTVVYGVVVAVLAAVYTFGVLGAQALLGAESPLAVAGATLGAAALFSPLRRLVQRWVDRRFDRARYDAIQVVDEFAARLRDEVDLDGLGTDLTRVVTSALRPAAVSLWVREVSP